MIKPIFQFGITGGKGFMKIVLVAMLILFLTACSSSGEPSGFAALPAGDAAQGAQLFVATTGGAPVCSTCHTIDGTASIGPSFQNYAVNAPVADAGTASLAEYTYSSITQPAAYIVSGFSNTMYSQYGRQLTPQQIADLIAYLQTL